MKNYYEKILKKLQISIYNVDSPLKIDNKTDAKLDEGNAELKTQAFSGFTVKTFDYFNYTIQVKCAEKLEKGFYLLVFKVS